MSPAPRNRTLVRTLCLLRALSTGRHSLEALAETFGVTPRTIRRDIDAFQEAHLPLTVEYREETTRHGAMRRGYWTIAPNCGLSTSVTNPSDERVPA